MKKKKQTLFKKSQQLAIKSDIVVCTVWIDPKWEIEEWPEPENAKAILMNYNQREEFARIRDKNEEMTEKETLLNTEIEHTNEIENCSDSYKLSGEQRSLLLDQLDSKLETSYQKINMLNTKRNSDNRFCVNGRRFFVIWFVAERYRFTPSIIVVFSSGW